MRPFIQNWRGNLALMILNFVILILFELYCYVYLSLFLSAYHYTYISIFMLYTFISIFMFIFISIYTYIFISIFKSITFLSTCFYIFFSDLCSFFHDFLLKLAKITFTLHIPGCHKQFFKF